MAGTSFSFAALIATWVYGLALALETSPWLHPDLEWCPSWPALREQLPRTFPWFLTVFAAVYVSLYTRFSSQWLYLANLYNQIRNTEARAAREKGDRYLQEVLSIWKAGFLEDAEVLHLAQKGIFVSVVRAWGANESVRQQFIANTYGGEKRLNTLMADVEDSYERHSSRYKRRRITK